MQKSNGGRIPIEVRFEDMPLEGMRFKMNGPDYHHVA